MAEPDIQAIMMTVVAEILRDRHLSFPGYQPGIKSEADAQADAATLPLIFSWNEVVRAGHMHSLTVSVNGGRIGQMLERYLPRSHSAFVPAQDTVTMMLCETQNRMMLSLCAEFGATPSGLTARLPP